MHIYGLDFTSRPKASKPITCAVCEIENGRLFFHRFQDITDFGGFESFCDLGETWVAGMDFPFGMPRKLIDDLHYPHVWEQYVAKFDAMSREDFVNLLTYYKSKQPKGSKEHRRITDIEAGSLSPMKLYGVPVGKMFFEGARRQARSGPSILPVRKRKSERIVLEAYPGLVARTAIGRRSYKTDDKRKQCAKHSDARRDLVARLTGADCARIYGMTIGFGDDLAKGVICDRSGDKLDAILCAVQAGWAFSKRKEGYGIPVGVDLSEGWIVDPQLKMPENAGAET